MTGGPRTLPDTEEGSGENRTSGIMPRARLDSWRVPEPPAQKERTELPPMSTSDLAIAATELARVLGGATSERELAEGFVSVLGGALPGRLIALRLEAPSGAAIATSSGRAVEVPLRVSRAAAELFDLGGDVAVEEAHAPVCPEADHGFDVPVLIDMRQGRPTLVGALHVEYPKGVRARPGELAPLLPLVASLSMAIEAVRARRERDGDRAQVEGLVRATAVPAFLLDTEGRILLASEGAAELMQRKVSDLVGQPAVDVAAEGTGAVVAEGLRRSNGGEAIARLEMKTQARHGGTRVIWTVVPAIGVDGRTRTTLALGKDLTAVARLEDQIVHAEKLATLGQLAAGVVHELNNPLTSISVYTDYLLQKGRRTGGDPADLERLGRIAEAAARMLRFTRDLVTYARPSTEEPSAVAIGEVLAQSAGFCEHVLRDANVTLTLHVPATLPPVRGLRGQLQQVFVNLYTNAAHAIVEKGRARGTIDVSVSVEDREAVVRVRDDGPGIRAEHRSKIFEPFFSTKAEGKGTGLGLSIVRNIVRLHGGAMELESRHAESGHSDTGTTFVVRLPLVEA